MRFVTVFGGTVGTAARQSGALCRFVGEALVGDWVGESLIFYHEGRDKQRLVELAPTPDARLVRTTVARTDRVVGILAELVRGEEIQLVLFAGGSAGTEMATRLACRTGGTVLTDALSIEVASEFLLGRRNVYSNHMVGRFELRARPWCVTLDGCWNHGRSSPAIRHRVLCDTGETTGSAEPGGTGVTPFDDLDLSEAPSTGDLAESRFLVVAGVGVGGREGLERIAEAARRMGADLGVSRPVAMNAWAPMDRLVGASGTRAAPGLCIVVGASGAPALYWGVEEATFIVAVNPDELAPIVKKADVVVLDDGVAVVEGLAAIIASEGKNERPRGQSRDG